MKNLMSILGSLLVVGGTFSLLIATLSAIISQVKQLFLAGAFEASIFLAGFTLIALGGFCRLVSRYFKESD